MSNIHLSLPTITIKSIDDKLFVYEYNEIDTEYLKTKHLQDIIFDGFILNPYKPDPSMIVYGIGHESVPNNDWKIESVEVKAEIKYIYDLFKNDKFIEKILNDKIEQLTETERDTRNEISPDPTNEDANDHMKNPILKIMLNKNQLHKLFSATAPASGFYDHINKMYDFNDKLFEHSFDIIRILNYYKTKYKNKKQLKQLKRFLTNEYVKLARENISVRKLFEKELDVLTRLLDVLDDDGSGMNYINDRIS